VFRGGDPFAFYDLTEEEQVECLAYMTRRASPEGWSHVAPVSAGELAGILSRLLADPKSGKGGSADAYLGGVG